MNKILIILKELFSYILNVIVFLVIGFGLIILTEGLVLRYGEINLFLSICWIVGCLLILTNTLRINWVSWIFSNFLVHEHDSWGGSK